VELRQAAVGGGTPGADEPDLSIVTVSFNTRDILRDALQAVEAPAGRLRLEHWVVDNGSSDGTVEMVQREFPRVSLVINPANAGTGPARNLVIPSCRATYVLNLDSDVIVHPGTMPALVDFMAAHPTVAAAGCKLLNADGTYQRSARHLRQIRPAIARKVRAILTRQVDDFSSVTTPIDVGWLVGALCIYRRDALEQVGLFDPQFFIYRDDLDLHTRLRLAGWQVAYVPTVTATHLAARTSDKNYAVARFDDEYGDLLFTRKYGPRWWYWYRRVSLATRSFYYARICSDRRLRDRFWDKSPAVLRRVYGELFRASLPIPGRRLASSSAPPAGIDWSVP
jgi:GT2 family glycosyltransferase